MDSAPTCDHSGICRLLMGFQEHTKCFLTTIAGFEVAINLVKLDGKFLSRVSLQICWLNLLIICKLSMK